MPPAPPACPSCGSALLQALRWAPLPDGRIDVGLRCPECESCTRVTLEPAGMRALDAEQRAARETLVLAHERLVGESMAALADAFGAALERDLLGADDFA